MSKVLTVGEYLIARLEQAGLKHAFGVPGDYVLGFYDLLSQSSVSLVGMVTEAGAGFAADAYARVNGLGAVCVTYCVGGFNVINSMAGAYAEKSPVIVISGAPGLRERAHSRLLHHRVRGFDTQRLIFEKITAAAEALEDPLSAPRQIDHAIAVCMEQKRPVYLELPRDIVAEPCGALSDPIRRREKSDEEALAEAVEDASDMLRAAKNPVILAGVELHRFGLQGPLVKLVEETGYPVAATLLGKSVISELHPQYVGVYEGAMGREEVRQCVENSDCVLILGAFMTDINLGVYTSHIDISRTINATSESISIQHHHYSGIQLRDFIESLRKCRLGARRKASVVVQGEPEAVEIVPDAPLTVRRFFEMMQGFLRDDSVVIADSGESIFGAADLKIHRKTKFIGPAYYLSMGFAVPASVGAQMNNRNLRPLVIVGDGAFQMSSHELSTAAMHGLNPIVLVLNNKGYSTQRVIHDGPFNNIQNWEYHKLPELMNEGLGLEAGTEGELAAATKVAFANTESFTVVNVHLEPYDHSEALERLGERLKKNIKTPKSLRRRRRGEK